MIVHSIYNTILASAFFIVLEKSVEGDRRKYYFVDSSSTESYSRMLSTNNTSSSSVQFETQHNELQNTTQSLNSSTKPGATQYHWYFYDYDQNQGHDNKNYQPVDVQPPQIQQYGSPPIYDLTYNYSPYGYGYTNNEVVPSHPPKYSKWTNYSYQKQILQKLFNLLGPVLFPLPFFLALMPLAIPAIPLAFFVSRIHRDDEHLPNMKPVSPTMSTSTTTGSASNSTTAESSTSFMSSSSSSSSSTSFTQTNPTSSSSTVAQPRPTTMSTQPPNSMSSSSSNSSFSSSSSSSGTVTSRMPSPNPTMMSTISNPTSTLASGGGSGSTANTPSPSRPPGIGFPNPPGVLPPYFPPFPFLFLNNTFDDMHYRKNSLFGK